MPKELGVALIAFCGIAISAFVSFLISRNVTNSELRKLRFETKKTYTSKLLEARLNAYPRLYSLLSRFLKEARYKTIHKSNIETLLVQIDEWDSENAILLSEHSGRICYTLRESLWQLLHNNEEELNIKLSTTNFIEELRTEAQTLELAIKSDIGIYGQDLVGAESGTRMTTEYKQVSDDLQHKHDNKIQKSSSR